MKKVSLYFISATFLSGLLTAQNVNFVEARGSPIDAGTSSLRGFASGDLNGDGKKDFVIGNSSANTLSIFLGNGAGQFSHANGSPLASGSDLIVANGTGNDVSLFFGQTDGSFVEAPGSPIATGQYAYQTAIADFNSDGQQDISVTNGLDDEVMFFLGSGTGSFTNADNSPIAVGTNPQPICTDDFDGDGKPDVLVGHFLSQDVIVLLNKNPVRISDPTKSRNLNAFPNPAKDGVRINVQNFQQGMVMIVFDAVGKEVDRVSVSSADFLYPGKNLAKGIYVFGIYFNNIELGSGKIIFE